MDIYGQIAKTVKEIVGGKETIIFPAEVKSVDGATCSVMIGKLQLSDVRLRSVINDKEDQVLITPAVGSQVLVADLSNGAFRDLAVLTYSEPEKIEIKIGQMEVCLSGEKISVKKGAINLFDLLDGLLTQILALTVPTGTGPSGTPVNASEFTQIKTKLGQIME
ncbi:MAG: hypothetical protein MJZ84_07520 [Paludibacteraceae bacterium]|nr:hypothetical protein [Paludibacteraceae bacterium]